MSNCFIQSSGVALTQATFLPKGKITLVLLVVGIVLAACSSKEIDPEVEPTELASFDSTLKVKKVWSKNIGEGTEFLRLALRPATDGTLIYAAAHDGTVQAFNAESGKRVWRASTDYPLSAGPGTNGNLVVAGSNDGDVVALDAETGEQRWHVRVTSEVLATPAVSADKVFFAYGQWQAHGVVRE